MRKMSRGVRGPEGTKKKFLWKWNLKRGVLLWNALDTNIFFFYLFFLILYFFSFEFLFLFLFSDDEEAHDIAVT